MKSRNKTVDILRGIGILIMIMGHIGIGVAPYDYYFSVWYHAFHMPLFFLISGYFTDKVPESWRVHIVKKTKQLLVPFFLWGMFHILYSFCLSGDINIVGQGIIRMILSPTVEGVPIAGALWFLPALFGANIIFVFTKKTLANIWIRFAVTCGTGICGMILASNGIYLPMALDAALVGVMFLGTGELLHFIFERNIGKTMFKIKWWILCLFSVINLVLIICNGEVNFRTGVYNNYCLTYINAVVGTMLIWYLSGIVNKYFNCSIGSIISKVLASVGENSLIYLCLNQIIIMNTMEQITQLFPDFVVCQLLARLLVLAIVCCVCHIIMRFMGKNRILRIFIGK